MEVSGRIVPPENRMPLVTKDDPVLRRGARRVSSFDTELESLLDRMLGTMYHEHGVGLAAPQVGVPLRIVVARLNGDLHQLINPEIVRSEGSQQGYEGCLSVPGYMGEVERPSHIRVRYHDRRGQRQWLDAEGWNARVLSHEIDHLDGALFIDCSERVLRLRPELGLRIVFMGTPEFARTSLEALLEDGYKVVGVVTAPDRRRGRGQRVHPSPVKEAALAADIPVLQPEGREDDAKLAKVLRWLEPDLLVTAAYGRILRPEILAIPRVGSINVHASLLPAYRGAAPIQHQILAGEERSGVTIYWMDEGMDSGPIILQKEIPLEEDTTAGELHDRLATLGVHALTEALGLIARGEAPADPQDSSRVSLAPKIRRADHRIEWQRSAASITRQVRAFCPRPGAETFWKGRRLKILAATPEEGVGEPGRIMDLSEEGILVGTGSGLCRVTRIQVEGKRAMEAAEFLRGYDLRVGDVLEEGDSAGNR